MKYLAKAKNRFGAAGGQASDWLDKRRNDARA
jgi:hypothetical protein